MNHVEPDSDSIRVAFGWDAATGLFWKERTQSFKRGGITYTRATRGWFGKNDFVPPPDGAWYADSGCAPAVLCQCGGDAFRVQSYHSGTHELVCIACGAMVDVS